MRAAVAALDFGPLEARAPRRSFHCDKPRPLLPICYRPVSPKSRLRTPCQRALVTKLRLRSRNLSVGGRATGRPERARAPHHSAVAENVGAERSLATLVRRPLHEHRQHERRPRHLERHVGHVYMNLSPLTGTEIEYCPSAVLVVHPAAPTRQLLGFESGLHAGPPLMISVAALEVPGGGSGATHRSPQRASTPLPRGRRLRSTRRSDARDSWRRSIPAP